MSKSERKIMVKLKIGYTSPETGILEPGTHAMLSEHIARSLIAHGHAERAHSADTDPQPVVTVPMERFYK